MKKIILSLSVCSMVLLFANCSNKDKNVIIEISDANFKAYLLENFDKNNDGNISVSEANAVKEINCSGMNIEDLTSIKMFKNLEILDCSNNKLDDIQIQKNRKLKKVNCKGNNAEFKIYFGMSSPLRNPNFRAPTSPQDVNSIINPLDVKKCLYDVGATPVVLFDE